MQLIVPCQTGRSDRSTVFSGHLREIPWTADLICDASHSPAKVRQRYLSHDGELRSEGSPLYGMTKEDGRWLLTFCQNTPVVDH